MRTEECCSELPPVGRGTRHRAIGRVRATLRQISISFEEEMMLLGLSMVSAWPGEIWSSFNNSYYMKMSY